MGNSTQRAQLAVTDLAGQADGSSSERSVNSGAERKVCSCHEPGNRSYANVLEA